LNRSVGFCSMVLTCLLMAGVFAPAHSDSGGVEGCCICPGMAAGLAQKYAPVFIQGEEIPAEPERLLYRAATGEDCRELFLAYHVVWPFENDPRKGFWPAVTRATYTGGLRLQRVIYGPGDVEVVGLVIDLGSGKVKKVTYETADYDKKKDVIHVPVELTGDEVPQYNPLAFEVVSWNHLFVLADRPAEEDDEKVYRLEPEPFTQELWKHYRMTKKRRHALSRDRAHYGWETEYLCPFVEPCGCAEKK